MMQLINALFLTPTVKDWLASSQHPRILHVFDNACNLVNEHREVLSIVTPQIGNGPFNLVVDGDGYFDGQLGLQAPVSVSPSQLTLGDFIVRISNAELWDPRPDWERLHARKSDIIDQLSKLPITNYRLPASQLSNSLGASLATGNLPASLTAARQLAGLGIGLTPSGDDFIMGVLYASWIIHPPEIASVLASEIANTAAPLTTSLSAAWIASAGRGEAGILWHTFFDALIAGDESTIRARIENILSVGETSGADALGGFFSTMRSYIAFLSRNEATLSAE